jgi:hypothetical protein
MWWLFISLFSPNRWWLDGALSFCFARDTSPFDRRRF